MACLVGVGVLPAAAALAQSAPGGAAPEASASAGGETPGASASSSAAPVYPATGYGWSPPHTNGSKTPHAGRPARTAPGESDSASPGFEVLADGSSRLYVQLSRPVTYSAKPGHGTLTYVLKGAHVNRWNNTNPLVTVHFNTPVTEARLVPHGSDLWFVLELRADVQPAVTMDAAKDGGAILQINFAKGDYLPADVAVDAPAASPSPVETLPAGSASAAPSSSAARPLALPRQGQGGGRSRRHSP
jgi:hypothetical protein